MMEGSIRILDSRAMCLNWGMGSIHRTL